jgi:hypothetical protein
MALASGRIAISRLTGDSLDNTASDCLLVACGGMIRLGSGPSQAVLSPQTGASPCSMIRYR